MIDGSAGTVIIILLCAFLATLLFIAHRAGARERLRADRLFGSSVMGIIYWNVKGQIEDANEAFLDLIGYTRAEMLSGRIRWSDTSPPEYLTRERDAAGELARTGKHRPYEKELIRKDGRRVPVLAGTAALEDGRFVGFFVDLSDRKRVEEARRDAEREAERAYRSKDEFLAIMSHELRTPLNAILGWSQVLKSAPPTDQAELLKALDTIERNAKAQAQLIDDLLDVSRITSGKLRLDAQSVDVVPCIEAAIEAVTPAAKSKGLQIDRNINAPASRIWGDAGRIQQIVWNLLSNAIKFTPRGGNVSVKVSVEKGELLLEVKDSGAGIEPSFLPHVFDRFRQADTTVTRKHGGLGLGLAIVQHLVALHAGSVRAESQGKDKGATFTVVLPLLSAHSETADLLRQSREVKLPPHATPELEGVSVLVVDDEPDARELVVRILGASRAHVVEAASANEALRQLENGQFDVIITDIGMPEEDGYTLIRKVRAMQNERARTPAIALTAFVRNEDRRSAALAGFQVHLPKPFEPEELTAIVANLAVTRSSAPN